MGLFKNEVGRPSNETIRTRRTLVIVLVLVGVALVGGLTFYVTKSLKKNNEISGTGKNAALSFVAHSGDVATSVDYTKSDGMVTAVDADLIYRFANNTTKPNDTQKKKADVDGDDKITKIDYDIIQRILTKNGSYYYGDVTKDGKLTTVDCNLILKFSSGSLKPDSAQKLLADVNKDGKINSTDARTLDRIVSKYGDVATAVDYTKPDGKKTKEDIDLITAFANSTKKPVNDMQKKAADVNKDGKITQADADILAGKSASKVTISFVLNGAKSIGKDKEECTLSNSTTCNIQFPEITPKAGFRVIGWSTNKDSKKAEVDQNVQKAVNSNQIYYAITESNYQYSAYFNYNKSYASNISNNSQKCYRYNGSNSCTVNVPSVTVQNGYKYEGWYDNDEEFDIIPTLFTETVKLKGSKEFDLVVSKIATVTFNKNKADSINISSANCKYYIIGNYIEGCKIEPSKIPRIYSKGNVVDGFSLSSTGEFKSVSSSKFDGNSTFHAKLGESNRKISVSKTEIISGVAFDVENSSNLKATAINKYINNAKDVYSKMPFLFDARTKVRLISINTYQKKLWDETTAGMAYGYSEFKNIDVSLPYEYHEYYTGTIVHELGHAWDHWYYISTGMALHNQSDIVALYNEYKNKSASNRPLRDYAYTNTHEFVAEMTSYYYYYKYNTSVSNPNGGNAINRFDNRLVKVFEKYASIAKNGYK